MLPRADANTARLGMCWGFLVPRTTGGAGQALLCQALCPAAVAGVGGFLPRQRCCLCLPRRTDVPGPGSAAAPAHYRNWNPPLLGNLPEDFLRILPQQTAGTQVRLGHPFQPGSVRWCGAPSQSSATLSLQHQHSGSIWVPGVH